MKVKAIRKGYYNSKVRQEGEVFVIRSKKDFSKKWMKTLGKVAPKEVIEDEVIEDEVIEDEVIEDEVIEDEVIEDEDIEDEPEETTPVAAPKPAGRSRRRRG